VSIGPAVFGRTIFDRQHVRLDFIGVNFADGIKAFRQPALIDHWAMATIQV